MTLSQEQPPSPLMDDAEAQMRRALGLFGDTPRHRPDSERSDSGQRAGNFMQGGAHRRRFVQDGEVPVTVVRRDASETPAAGTPAAGPSHSRLHRVEAALQAEVTARDRAERALHEAQAMVQALQTKIGHNELAKNEAVAAAKRDRDAVVVLREQIIAGTGRLQELEENAAAAEEELRALRAECTEERRARKLAERLLREASSEEPLLAMEQTGREEDVPVRVAPRRGRPPTIHAAPEVEQEPFKWWLTEEKPSGKRR